MAKVYKYIKRLDHEKIHIDNSKGYQPQNVQTEKGQTFNNVVYDHKTDTWYRLKPIKGGFTLGKIIHNVTHFWAAKSK